MFYRNPIQFDKKPDTFLLIAFDIIKRRFGKDLLEKENKLAIIYYMRREIEAKSDFLGNLISTINTLERMGKNIGVSCILNFIVLFLPIRFSPTPTKCGVGPFSGVEPVEGRRSRPTGDSEQ